jgi:intracellular sulfur oxidation DsrE/DsrF family protein
MAHDQLSRERKYEMKYINILIASVVVSLSLASLNAAATETPAAKERLVIQVSDADTGKWNLALNNAKNVQNAYGADKVDIEIVAYGPGIGMLKMDSVVGNRIDESKQSGITVVACQNTMKNMKLTNEDMLPNSSYVPSGVVEIIKKQNDGYAYLRP